MRYEYVTYSPFQDLQRFKRVKAELPETIRKELIVPKKPSEYIYVEASKIGIVKYLDNAFEVDKALYCKKSYSIIIDRKEIENFTHFNIGIKPIEVNRSFFCQCNPPICSVDGCFVGSEISGPVKMKCLTANRLGIAQLGRAWGKPVELIISAKLKKLFDRENVSGLNYEPVKLLDVDQHDNSSFSAPFLVRITNSIYSTAKKVILSKTVCEEHNIVYFQYIHEPRIPKESLLPDDFLELCGIIVESQIYNFHVNKVIVSRKVLEILLDNKIKGLVNMGFLMDMKFTPCMLIK
ncbi:MAG: hypothetical protein JXA96_13690 [Sedimentisphaerales bacterium]|nr:hypothetical protein [Sedimentisphaerales bacterium]